MPTWMITGASRGFGLELARQALQRGDSVVATARTPDRIAEALPEAGDRLLALALDVTDEAAARTAVAAGVQRFGSIDVLVNNAGHGLLGAVEEVSDAEARAVFDVNVFGLLAVTRAVLPVMRSQRSGRILQLSSVAGQTAAPGWGVYAASKFAVEGLSEALHGELAPLGIGVTIVEPGRFRTDFLDPSSLLRAESVLGDYEASAGAMRGWADAANHGQPGDPVKAAAAMIEVALADAPPLRLQLGSDCVERVEAKLDAVRGELEAWRHLAVSTDHDDVASAA